MLEYRHEDGERYPERDSTQCGLVRDEHDERGEGMSEPPPDERTLGLHARNRGSRHAGPGVKEEK